MKPLDTPQVRLLHEIYLDIGRRTGGHLGTRGSVHSAEILQDGGFDKFQFLLRVGVLHVADTDPQAVCVHVVVIVAQRLCWQAAQQELP